MQGNAYCSNISAVFDIRQSTFYYATVELCPCNMCDCEIYCEYGLGKSGHRCRLPYVNR